MIRVCRLHQILATLAVAILPSVSFAQGLPEPTGTPKLLAINALIGGLSGGIGNAAAGRRFLPGFVKGVGGGIVMFAGKRIIAEEGALAAWTGRQLAAVGSSQVRNAAAGRSIIEELVFPLGPTRLYVTTKNRPKFALKLDLTATIGAVIIARRPNTSLDLDASLANGAVIFNEPYNKDSVFGALRLGVIRVDNIPPHFEQPGTTIIKSSVIAHELIHAAQYDFIGIAWSEPLEKWALSGSRAGRLTHRYVDFSVVTYLTSWAHVSLPPGRRPLEREAISLAPGR